MAGMTVSRPAVPASPEHALAPPTPGHVLEVVQGLWPRELAEPWDAVGPVAGRPEAPVRTVLWALDPVQAVADEAVARGADLVVT
ncbi:Nif3-like dinuclear metal center hexameric protein, partial [Enterococcus faecalis]|nr:Nif3-like dinuclear metal center hexameric protein [Enterococcus faecalis]